MYDTPDLSKEFHPQPKVYKAKKEAKPLPKMGAKTKEWEDTRAVLKKKFAQWGITSCEIRYDGCWKNNSLTFAHVDKRINLRADELTAVVLACTPCHQIVEAKPHKEMREELEKIIAEREYR